MKSCKTILAEKQQKYQHFHLGKSINMNMLEVTKYYLLTKNLILQVKFAYSPLETVLEKQTEKQFDVIKSLENSNKKDELKQIESIFPQNLMNDLMYAKLKEIVTLQDIEKKDDLYYTSKRRRTYNSHKYSLRTISLRDIHEGYLSLKNTDINQSNFATELKNFEKGTKKLKKKSFLNNLGL